MGGGRRCIGCRFQVRSIEGLKIQSGTRLDANTVERAHVMQHTLSAKVSYSTIATPTLNSQMKINGNHALEIQHTKEFIIKLLGLAFT